VTGCLRALSRSYAATTQEAMMYQNVEGRRASQTLVRGQRVRAEDLVDASTASTESSDAAVDTKNGMRCAPGTRLTAPSESLRCWRGPQPPAPVPLADLGSLMLYATRHTRVLPNIAVVRRFPGEIPLAAIEAEADRMASHPYGLGRCLMMPKVRGARPLWRANPEPPPVSSAPDAVDASAFATWLADEMSARSDPLEQAGWHLATIRFGGFTFVALVMNHLYGTGRALAMSIWGDQGPQAVGPSSNGKHVPDTRALSAAEHDLGAEIGDVVRRVRTGMVGLARLGTQSLPGPQRRRPYGERAALRRPLHALLDRDPSRGKPSTRRVSALATVSLAAWEEAALRNGGTGLALQVAVTANLLREARRARGGDTFRPLRIIVPVDLSDRSVSSAPDATMESPELTSAEVVISGGLPVHGDLAEVREACRRAIQAARAEVAATGRVPVAPGMVDAMRLLPDAVTVRAVINVHARFDGAVSAMGRLVPGMNRLGEYVASDLFAVAFPLGSDLSVTTGIFDEILTFGIVADPSRLGAGPSLRERFGRELEQWKIEAEVW
jgi:diacylglycerol O-acyltransferase / wax synthase